MYFFLLCAQYSSWKRISPTQYSVWNLWPLCYSFFRLVPWMKWSIGLDVWVGQAFIELSKLVVCSSAVHWPGTARKPFDQCRCLKTAYDACQKSTETDCTKKFKFKKVQQKSNLFHLNEFFSEATLQQRYSYSLQEVTESSECHAIITTGSS